VDGQKMSKSYGNTIDIFAEGKPLEKVIMGIKTDSTPLGQPLNPDTCNVYALYSLFATDEEKAALAADYRAGRIGYGGAKKLLKAKIDEYFGPARARRKELAQRPGYVEDVLSEGARKARIVTQETMDLVREAAGLQAARR
jgi:tryptophanyl-tRNA synthetase